MTTARRANRAIVIMRVWARCCEPFGLMPVTAATAVMRAAMMSQLSQVMGSSLGSRPGSLGFGRLEHGGRDRLCALQLFLECFAIGVEFRPRCVTGPTLGRGALVVS